jgi:uncharacterized protein YkwD
MAPPEDAPEARLRDAARVRLASPRVLPAIAALLVAAAAALAPAPAGARSGAHLTALESGVLRQINFIRHEHGLAPVHLNARLTAAAAQHSQEMGADGYFEHESVDGSPFWKRVERYYPSAGRRYWSVGENILWSSPSVSPSSALQLWMNSPEHRANILTPRWREIGVSAVHFAHATGVYGGRPVTIVTTDFGVRD